MAQRIAPSGRWLIAYANANDSLSVQYASLLHPAALSTSLAASIVVRRIQPRKQHLGETEAGEVAYAHRIQNAGQVVAFMLHHARMEVLDFAHDGLAVL